MTICFITGGLKPGSGGVADYTTLLALQCQQMGHKAILIGINDLDVDDFSEEIIEGVTVLRISTNLSWSNKWDIASKFKRKYNLDWVSIQFVPYAFNNRGIFKDFLKGIKGFVSGINCHINLHEIWIGEYPNAKFKERIIGCIQKKLIVQMINQTKPKVINYSNAGAKTRLERNNIKCSYLPIFSNIPIVKNTDKSWIMGRLAEASTLLSSRINSGFIFYGFFGSLHYDWPARQLLERLRMYTSAQGKSPALLHAGILPRNKSRWKELKKNYSGDWLIHSFGKLPEDEISHYIQGLNYGLTSTPWDLVGKSGSVAAMVEHGVPVIVNTMGGTPGAPLIIQDDFQSLIIKADEHLLLNLKQCKSCKPVINNLEKVALRFIDLLDQSNWR